MNVREKVNQDEKCYFIFNLDKHIIKDIGRISNDLLALLEKK
jgi:hypothetical protein